MANHYRITLDAWSASPNPLHSFLGTLISDSWYGFLPVPQREFTVDESGDDSIAPEIDTWGAYLFPDMRILTRAGIVEVCEPGTNLPYLAAASIDERAAYLRAEKQPAFLPPDATDHMASIIAESRAGIPCRSFVNVTDGLRTVLSTSAGSTRPDDHVRRSAAASAN